MPFTSRWALLTGLYLTLGVAGAIYLWDSTAVGADLDTYRVASAALYAGADPYAATAHLGEDFQYRYPPLLALLTYC
jgi:hypothetical protein